MQPPLTLRELARRRSSFLLALPVIGAALFGSWLFWLLTVPHLLGYFTHSRTPSTYAAPGIAVAGMFMPMLAPSGQ